MKAIREAVNTYYYTRTGPTEPQNRARSFGTIREIGILGIDDISVLLGAIPFSE